MWKIVLFDLDGTLTDSGEGITKSVQYALRKGFGIEVQDIHELDCFVGPPLKEQFMKFASLTEEQGEYAVEVYRERYRDIGIFENLLYPGIPELLKSLHDAGMKIAVSSSKPTVFCQKILEHFGVAEYFTVIAGSELDGRRTKKSEVIESVLESLGVSDHRGEVVIVGDRSYDIVGGKETGIGTIGVTYGYGSREELASEHPDFICDNAEELQQVLLHQYQEGIQKLVKTGSTIPMDGPLFFESGRGSNPS